MSNRSNSNQKTNLRLAITCKVETQCCKFHLSNNYSALASQDLIHKRDNELEISHMMMTLHCSMSSNERLLLFYNNFTNIVLKPNI